MAAAEFAKLSLPLPFLQPGAEFSDGVNFASAGSCVLDTNSTNMVISFSALSYLYIKLFVHTIYRLIPRVKFYLL